jgi:hypothetical protein
MMHDGGETTSTVAACANILSSLKLLYTFRRLCVDIENYTLSDRVEDVDEQRIMAIVFDKRRITASVSTAHR